MFVWVLFVCYKASHPLRLSLAPPHAHCVRENTWMRYSVRIERHEESDPFFSSWSRMISRFLQGCAACARHTRHGSWSRRLSEVGWGVCRPHHARHIILLAQGHRHNINNCPRIPATRPPGLCLQLWPSGSHPLVQRRACSDALLRSEATNGHADISIAEAKFWIVHFSSCFCF